MELNEIWSDFSERMAEIELYKLAAKDSAKKELSLINENFKAIKNNPDLKDLSASLNNMSFYDARSGEIKFYNYKDRSFEDLYLHVLLHKNKQYQWLLSEAYEEFEDYLENLYAYYGNINNSFWPLKDFGNISLSELDEKDYEWYVTQARKKKDIPSSILNRFRKYFPELKTIETTNKLQVNLSLAIALIEKLRHVIVHKGGKVSSKNAFVKLTTEQVGLYNGGSVSEDNINLINLFFGENEYENLITLLEIRVHPEVPFDVHVSIFDKLTGFLMAYAYLLYQYVDSNAAGD